jgi:hypothetical protein
MQGTHIVEEAAAADDSLQPGTTKAGGWQAGAATLVADVDLKAHVGQGAHLQNVEAERLLPP